MTTPTDRPYVARHLGFDYTSAQHGREVGAQLTEGAPRPARGQHAAYDDFVPSNPERRPAVELPDEVTP